jgi:hypothetical protein
MSVSKEESVEVGLLSVERLKSDDAEAMMKRRDGSAM